MGTGSSSDATGGAADRILAYRDAFRGAVLEVYAARAKYYDAELAHAVLACSARLTESSSFEDACLWAGAFLGSEKLEGLDGTVLVEAIRHGVEVARSVRSRR